MFFTIKNPYTESGLRRTCWRLAFQFWTRRCRRIRQWSALAIAKLESHGHLKVLRSEKRDGSRVVSRDCLRLQFCNILFILKGPRVENLSPAMGRGIDSRKRVWNRVAKLHRLAGRYDNPILAKGKSLGRSKPATNSQAQALATHCVEYSTISKSYRTAFYRNKLSTTKCEWVRLFISQQSSLHIVAWDLDVERSQLCKVLVAKTRTMSNPVTQQKDLLTKYMRSLQ